jgi:hypothetical protein
MLRPDRRKSLVLAGAAVALVGAGAATAAGALAAGGPSPKPQAAANHVVVPSLGTQARLGATPPATPAGGAPRPAASHVPESHPAALTWAQVSSAINRETNPRAARQGKLPAADQLRPVRTSGQQEWMPIGSAQRANATTIVREALHQRMGLRSAVIAVATAMQESMLQNIDYGTGTALGLFQQQPNSGWGSPAQVTNPVYAAHAFLAALQRHQAGDPSWARQPLWANAQSVQNSAFPQAYAKWESQAASLVKHIALHVAGAKLTALRLR